jgi:poly-gamma-glutamate synthesis protein (capsule biosynthesis protein)
MIADAKAAREAGAEVVIVSMHAGEENVATPNEQQRSVAKALANSGLVNLVIGNHVHVVQPAQKIGNMWIVYGHGNLISGQHVEDHRNREGVVSEFTLTEQPDGGFAVTRAVGYPVLNTANPVRLVDLVKSLPKTGGDSRELEAYWHTRETLLSMGAGRDGFVVPAPGSNR